MKYKRIFIIITLILLSFITLVGCDFTMYTVTFNSNGGTAVSSKSTTGIVARPTEPTRNGYTFGGWYADEALTQAFDFNSKISGDITLYAKWISPDGQDNSGGENQGSQGGGENQGGQSGTDQQPNQGGGEDAGNQTNPNTNEDKKYTVIFETNGGTPIESVEVSGKLIKPTDPVKENYRFDGWFLDSNFANEFNFNTTLSSDITLYAKWSHIDNVEYKEGSYNNEQVDPYILAANPSTFTYQVNSLEDFAFYLDYAIFNRLDSITVTLNIDYEEASREVRDALQIEFECSFGSTFTPSTKEMVVNFEYNDFATVSASDDNLYTQVPFVSLSKSSSRLESFNDFKINQNNNTYLVTDSEQLCYVIEHGYRPSFSSNDCSAKRMYDYACSILVSICDDSFSDIEKMLAIYDWLVENITYDKALLDKMISGEKNLNRYKGFYLEGVFEDRRAVCDGIAKAFMLMARIEGIECVKVTGTSKVTGVGHAWNKVRLNGRWYIVDVTSGNLVIGGASEMLAHRAFMCNDEYYNVEYDPDDYLNFVADSEYNIYRDMKYVYNEEEHDYFIEDTDELAIILSYLKTVDEGGTKSIDFYYAGSEAISSALVEALTKAKIYGAYSNVNHDGAIIFRYSN